LQNDFRRGDLYFSAQQYDSARSVFSGLRSQVEGGNQLFVDFRLAQIDEKVLEQKGQKLQALGKMNEMLTKFQPLAQMGAGQELQALKDDRDRLGVSDSIKGAPGEPPQQDITRDTSKNPKTVHTIPH
jgi:hypothetical protein